MHVLTVPGVSTSLEAVSRAALYTHAHASIRFMGDSLDLDGDGGLYDDSFLIDNRLRPLPNRGATLDLDRYSVVIPEGTVGPISVTGAVYDQSMEAVVPKKFLGNLADTDLDHVFEPWVLKSPGDGRTPSLEPAVVRRVSARYRCAWPMR